MFGQYLNKSQNFIIAGSPPQVSPINTSSSNWPHQFFFIFSPPSDAVGIKLRLEPPLSHYCIKPISTSVWLSGL
ncbi:hypothetical protein CROQUDRAFT_102470 [Cronartium quercuum f. sp. fusiforme G11]|uniref:Uncharacterized protein n=1 Tax=Cronartium quercuum f. sp. fusiforme G11 TaxID=708437 RepID=A0A9P6N7A1_9BASI|nr:hypothetical protein CROQUDRAFT_102470 [Cronartium quercuum f. sp. fusiforme G11]